MKCDCCGASLGMFKKYVPLSDGAICLKCFKKLGFDPNEKDKYKDATCRDIQGGYGYYMKKLNGDTAPKYSEYFVSGFDYNQSELISLLYDESEDYRLSKKAFIEEVYGRVYQYEVERYPAMLVPEPDNEYDANAIAVYVNDVKIGYIARKDQNKIDLDNITDCQAEIYGGKYKEYDGETILQGETPYKAKLYIK